ncbi:hypothetical protein ACOSQ2_031923 [Xanthoceras sorbifolium]
MQYAAVQVVLPDEPNPYQQGLNQPHHPFHPNRGLFHNNICPIHPISPFHPNRGPVHNNRGLIYPNQAPIQTASQIQLMNQRKPNF